ncbi:MAG: tetratricopeptide repeat protein [Verrucomicrobia bacterium]|nr:tetratricopeptide repeat protein [Verrucomicrobiota bacterium]
MRNSRWPFWALFGILLTTLAAYAPVFSAAFLNLDDYRYLTAVRPFDAARIVYIFTHFFEGYHPLTLVSLGLTFRLADFNPWLHHAVNVLLHLTNTALVYALVRRLLQPPAPPPGSASPAPHSVEHESSSLVAAALAAAIFGLHPIHMEAVAWVTSRKDVLYTLFYLIGLLAYLAHRKWRAFAWMLLAVLSKGMAVSFPLALIALDIIRRRPINARTLILEKLPFWMLAAIFGLISIRAQQASGYVPDLSGATDIASRVGLALGALWLYVSHLIDLNALAAFHPYPAAPLARVYAFAGAACLLVASLTAIRLRRAHPALVGALGIFLAGIVLVLQLVPVADFIIADRYAYLASLGFCLGLSLLAVRVGTVPRLRLIATCAIGAYLIALGCVTHTYASAWRDSDTLWTHALARHPSAVFPLNMRGCARNDLGRYADAIADFDAAAALAPAYPRTYLNRGYARDKLGHTAAALSDYTHFCQLAPADPLGHNNRGLALRQLGNPQEALAAFSEAIRLSPNHPVAHLFFANRAESHLANGNTAEAIADATAAITRFPRAFRAYLTRAEAHMRNRNRAAADADLAQAAAIDPHDPRPNALRATWTETPE